MNAWERVTAAMDGRPVDRVPMSFWRHFDHDMEDEREVAQAHRAFFDQTGVDFVKVMHDHLTAPFDLNCGGLSDLRRIRPRAEGNPYCTRFVERVHRVCEAIHGDVPVIVNVFAPFMLLRKIGDPLLADCIRRSPGAVEDALKAITDTLCRMVDDMMRVDGCIGVFACFQGAEIGRFTRENYDRFVKPFDVAILNAASGVTPYNIAHYCAWDGNANDMTYWQKDWSGCVNWDTHIDRLALAEGRDFFACRSVLGGFSNRKPGVLWQGCEQEIAEETRRLLTDYFDYFGHLNGLMLGADCSLASDFNLTRLRVVRETADTVAKELTCHAG